MNPHEKRHLGDGVYVSFDGYQLWLTTPRPEGEHRIALEPAVQQGLVSFCQDMTLALTSPSVPGAEARRYFPLGWGGWRGGR